MCRLFGFRSVIPSQVHRSLIAANNSLGVQSQKHPDGWGVAFYIDGVPHLTKSSSTAMDDALFRRVSGVVSSETVIAHVRNATQGHLSVLNSHPFQYGKWVLAHNGDIPNFASIRDTLDQAIAPRLRRFILGDTDSERIFFLFLTELSKYGELSQPMGLEEVIPALRNTVATVRKIADTPDNFPKRSLLTLLITNGQIMVAHQGGKELYYSTWKRKCGDRDFCPSLAKCCENPTEPGGRVNHLVIASEPLQGENVWEPLDEGDIVGVDWRMGLAYHRGGEGTKRQPLEGTSCLNW